MRPGWEVLVWWVVTWILGAAYLLLHLHPTYGLLTQPDRALAYWRTWGL